MYQMTGNESMFPWSLNKVKKVTVSRVSKVRGQAQLSFSNLDGAVNRGHKQTYLIILDFAKAFDKFPHRRLLHKLDYDGIRWCTHRCINSWLSGHTQQVVLDSQKVSEYDQEIPQSHTAAQPTAPWGRVTEHLQ